MYKYMDKIKCLDPALLQISSNLYNAKVVEDSRLYQLMISKIREGKVKTYVADEFLKKLKEVGL